MTSEIAAALAKFFFGGAGPRHTTLTNTFMSCGLADVSPYDAQLGTPNKEQRIYAVCREASRRSVDVSTRLLESLLTDLRIHGVFDDSDRDTVHLVATLERALRSQGFALDEEGRLEHEYHIDLSTNSRPALEQQLSRLRRNAEDPGVLLGGAKELLEAICKFVLEEQSMMPARKMSFEELLALALDRLKLQPTQVNIDTPGGRQVRAIYQSAKTTASAINELRNLQGTGHGRTLPTEVSQDVGRYVIREATHIAELMLRTHDRQMGRSQ